MPFDIITIEPTTVDGGHAAGDVFFNLTKVELPARSCKLVSVFAECAGTAADVLDVKIGILFFKKNTTTSLGTLDATADIAHADFTANEYIGQTFLGFHNGAAELDVDVIDNMYFLYPCSWSADTGATGEDGEHLSVFEPMVLKGTSGNSEVYAAAVVHDGAPDVDGTDNVKIHFHVEY